LHLDDPNVHEAAIKALTYPTIAYKEGFVPPGANWAAAGAWVISPAKSTTQSHRHHTNRDEALPDRCEFGASLRSFFGFLAPGDWPG
jgi:hypothetical protein